MGLGSHSFDLIMHFQHFGSDQIEKLGRWICFPFFRLFFFWSDEFCWSHTCIPIMQLLTFILVIFGDFKSIYKWPHFNLWFSFTWLKVDWELFWKVKSVILTDLLCNMVAFPVVFSVELFYSGLINIRSQFCNLVEHLINIIFSSSSSFWFSICVFLIVTLPHNQTQPLLDFKCILFVELEPSFHWRRPYWLWLAG